MFARVAVPLSGSGMLLIPATAIQEQGQLTGVYVVDRDQIARFRLVRIGKTFDTQVEIVSGLAPGQRLVAAIPLDLRDGVKVEAAE
jgi:hypothetical protein